MKKIMKRGLSAALALALSASLLAGCSSSEYDPIQEAFGYSKDTALMTVNGNDVTAEDIFFWMSQNVDYVASSYTQMGMDVEWDAPMGDMTIGEMVKDQSEQNAILYSIVAAKAEEMGYTVTEEDEAAYAEDLAAAQEQLGGEEAYEEFLKTMLVTESGMERLSSVGILYNHMAEGLCREGGEYAPTQEDLDKLVADSDLLWAKHILLKTTDDTGAALPEEEAAAKLAQAEALVAELQAITDPAELEKTFDEKVAEFGEDPGTAANPDGYLFTADEMVPEFEEGTRALAYGQVSGVVETSYGYHIILRLDPTQSETILDQWQTTTMDTLMQEWIAEAEVVKTEDYEALTAQSFYETLTAYRETLEPKEEAAPEEETPAEEEAPAEEEVPADEPPAEEAPAEGDAEAEEPAE